MSSPDLINKRVSGAAWIAERAGGSGALVLGGRWGVVDAARLAPRLRRLRPRGAVEGGAIEAIDDGGALVLSRALALWGRPIEGLAPDHAELLARMAMVPPPVGAGTRPRGPLDLVAALGEGAIEAVKVALELVAFLGLVITRLAVLLAKPWRLRGTAFVSQLEAVGVTALPIVGLLAFLIGVVLAYQGADQLRPFGAQSFTVNLLAVSVLREIGVLITAIIVAGRSGSSFTAQIGTMQVNQEIDAMRVIGLDPIEELVIPRVLALIIALPLLAFFADVVALFGGGVVCYLALDMSVTQYLRALSEAATAKTALVGLAKAPIFALLIALVGCFEGLKVTGSAESVGRRTTTAVVEAIFLVIVADAAFSILFSALRV